MGLKIYLATSWRNEHYTQVLGLLRDAGHEVYDYREKGFLFSNISPMNHPVDELSPDVAQGLLNDPVAIKAFRTDYEAMQWADVIVMLYPCGNDAHVELGWFAGEGKTSVVYVKEGYKVGLMDKVATHWVFNDRELLEVLK